MSATLDSENVFKARALAIGLEPALLTDLINAGLTTMSKLAFLCGIQPGTSDDKPFVLAIHEILTRDPDTAAIPTLQMSLIRRLWFESHTGVMAEVKHRLEQTEESLPKKLPLVEREARRRLQSVKLSGVDLTGHLEPAHSLVDFVWSLKEADTLQYVDPAKCGSRESELKGNKVDSYLKTDSSGRVVTVNKDRITNADTSTEYRLRLALQRRSLALDQVDILPYAWSERYHDDLFALTMRQVPNTHVPISISQVMEADRTVWARCAQICRNGLSPQLGKYPFEEALVSAKSDPVVLSILQPMSKPASGERSFPYQRDYFKSGKGDSKPYFDSGKGRGGKQDKGGRGKGNGKGGKGKKGKMDSLPMNLRGRRVTTSGDRICFNYNLQTCETTGSRCDRGVHVCCFCNENHPYATCPKKN